MLVILSVDRTPLPGRCRSPWLRNRAAINVIETSDEIVTVVSHKLSFGFGA